jgi:diguanylate cyclase (GGDEF)-like protein
VTVGVGDEPFFTRASRDVLAYLRDHVPMGFWAVTRVENGRQTYLMVDDEAYGLRAGGFHDWQASFCIHMSAGTAPRVAPDAQAVPLYAAAGVNDAIRIGAYAGAEVQDEDGQLFGAICGLDPEAGTEDLAEIEPLLVLLSRLLSVALAADRAAQRAEGARLTAQLAADIDVMTSVFSRRAWDQLLAQAHQRFEHFGDPTAVVVIDLDGLKVMNDSQGHAAGDALIANAARAVRAGVRADDPVARIGGDEFAVLLRDCTADAARERADGIRRSLAAAGVLASVGVAAAEPGGGLEAAVRAADAAMYAEKSGRAAEPREGVS